MSNDGITDSLTDGDEVRVPDALIQPIPADEVVEAMVEAVISPPSNRIRNVGGPAKMTFEQMVSDVLAARGDSSKRVVVDPEARYFGARLKRSSLVTTG